MSNPPESPTPPSDGPKRPTSPPAAPPPAPPPSPAGRLLVPNPSGPPSPEYPAQVEISYPEELSRGLPFVKWLLALPHYLVLFVLAIGGFFAVVYSWFAVLITGRYPRGVFDFLVGLLRWSTRVSAYVYLQTDQYPPFSLEDDPGYPVQVHVEYQEEIDRWRPLVHWLLVIPAAIGSAVLLWVAGIIEFLAWFVIVFTKRFPRGMFEFVTAALRWQVRTNAYYLFMTEKYPPFVYG